MFSRTCQYALQAVLYIALHFDEHRNIGLSEIAGKQDIPPHFLSKILQQLVKNGILSSSKGPTGGFALRRSPDEITLIEIVREIDGLDIFDRCGIGFKICSDKSPCPIHHEFKLIREKIRFDIGNKTISALCKDVVKGNSFISFKNAD